MLPPLGGAHDQGHRCLRGLHRTLRRRLSPDATAGRTGVPRQRLYHRQPRNFAHRRGAQRQFHRRLDQPRPGRQRRRCVRAPLLRRWLSARGRVPGQHLHHGPSADSQCGGGRRRRIRGRLGQYARGDLPRRLRAAVRRGGRSGGRRVPGEHIHHPGPVLAPDRARRRRALRGGLAHRRPGRLGVGARGPPLRSLGQCAGKRLPRQHPYDQPSVGAVGRFRCERELRRGVARRGAGAGWQRVGRVRAALRRGGEPARWRLRRQLVHLAGPVRAQHRHESRGRLRGRLWQPLRRRRPIPGCPRTAVRRRGERRRQRVPGQHVHHGTTVPLRLRRSRRPRRRGQLRGDLAERARLDGRPGRHRGPAVRRASATRGAASSPSTRAPADGRMRRPSVRTPLATSW